MEILLIVSNLRVFYPNACFAIIIFARWIIYLSAILQFYGWRIKYLAISSKYMFYNWIFV